MSEEMPAESVESQESNHVESSPSQEKESLHLKDVVGDILDGEDSDDDNATPAEAEINQAIREYKKKLKLKVDGEEIEEEIDFNDDERLKRALQKEKAFDKRSQEFSSLQKQVGEFVDSLKGNPFQVLEQMGIQVEDLVLDYAKRAVEESEKSPEQLAREKMEKELDDLRKEKERLAKEKENTELERMRNEHAQQIEADIKGALDATDTILPKKNPRVLSMIAETMLLAMNNGYPEVTAKDVIPLVEKRFESDFRSMFDVFPEEIIERVVGKPNLDRLRKKRIKNRRPPESAKQAVKPTNGSSKPSEKEKAAQKTYKDLFDPRF